MKKLILLIGLVVLLLTGCSKFAEADRNIYGHGGLSIVAQKGAVILEKSYTTGIHGENGRFTIEIAGDTIDWLSVPITIYSKYNVGDTIKPL